MNLRTKKTLVAEVLGVGLSRVRFSPNSLDRVEDAITRDSIRALVKDGTIRIVPAKGISRGRHRLRSKKLKKRGRGPGSKEGAKGAHVRRKELWIARVRVLRYHLKILRDRGEITPKKFRELYKIIKGGQLKTVKHLKETVRTMAATEL